MENPNQSPEETPAEDPYERIKQEYKLSPYSHF